MEYYLSVLSGRRRQKCSSRMQPFLVWLLPQVPCDSLGRYHLNYCHPIESRPFSRKEKQQKHIALFDHRYLIFADFRARVANFFLLFYSCDWKNVIFHFPKKHYITASMDFLSLFVIFRRILFILIICLPHKKRCELVSSSVFLLLWFHFDLNYFSGPRPTVEKKRVFRNLVCHTWFTSFQWFRWVRIF